jgi:hypothetical protein
MDKTKKKKIRKPKKKRENKIKKKKKATLSQMMKKSQLNHSIILKCQKKNIKNKRN